MLQQLLFQLHSVLPLLCSKAVTAIGYLQSLADKFEPRWIVAPHPFARQHMPLLERFWTHGPFRLLAAKPSLASAWLRVLSRSCSRALSCQSLAAGDFGPMTLPNNAKHRSCDKYLLLRRGLADGNCQTKQSAHVILLANFFSFSQPSC